MPVKLQEVGIGTFLTQKGWFNAAQNLKVLGLDMALTSTGWALIRNGNLSAGFWAPETYRCGFLSNEAEQVLATSKPDVVSVEDMSFQKSFEAYQVGMGTGAIMSKVELYLYTNKGTGLLKVHPTRLKYMALHSAGATKEDVQKYVLDMLNVCGIQREEFLPTAKRQFGDVCDAVVLAICGLVAHGINADLIDPKSLGVNHEMFCKAEKNLCSMLKAATS